MKVLMTADAVGGVWTYAMELCQALSSREVDVVLAVMGPQPNEAQRAEADALANVRLECEPFKLEWMRDPWTEVEQAGEWLQALAHEQRVDLVHLNGYVHAARSWLQPVLVVAHSCVSSWWRAVHASDPPSEWDEYRRRVQAGLRSAHRVVAPTQAFLAELQRCYGLPSSSSVIYNARTPARLAVDTSMHREPLVFACGRLWDEAKNMRALDVAATSVSWPVFVAGEARSPEGRRFEPQAIQTLGVLTAEEIAAWLGRAAIYVHPSAYEPFGLAVLEAALSGCALVLSDLPTLRELWDGAAVFVAHDEPQAIGAALNQLIAQPQHREQLSHAARARAARFAPAVMGDQYLHLYHALRRRSAAVERAVA